MSSTRPAPRPCRRPLRSPSRRSPLFRRRIVRRCPRRQGQVEGAARRRSAGRAAAATADGGRSASPVSTPATPLWPTSRDRGRGCSSKGRESRPSTSTGVPARSRRPTGCSSSSACRRAPWPRWNWTCRPTGSSPPTACPSPGRGRPISRGLKRWHVSFSGRPSLALTLRRRPEAGEPRVLLAGHLLTRQKLTPDSVEADFTFDHLKVLGGEVREADLRPRPLPAAARGHRPRDRRLDVCATAGPGAPALLTVRLPAAAGVGVAGRPLLRAASGRSPRRAVRPSRSRGRPAPPPGRCRSRRETLILQVPPTCRWTPGTPAASG